MGEKVPHYNKYELMKHINEEKHLNTDPAVWVFNWLLMKSLKSHVSTSLPPVVYDDSEMLILGAKLLKNDKYETAKSNRFWQDISKRYKKRIDIRL